VDGISQSYEGRGVDPNVVAEIGQTEGDSLDFVETTVALEEAFGPKLNKPKRSHKVDLAAQGK